MHLTTEPSTNCIKHIEEQDDDDLVPGGTAGGIRDSTQEVKAWVVEGSWEHDEGYNEHPVKGGQNCTCAFEVGFELLPELAKRLITLLIRIPAI